MTAPAERHNPYVGPRSFKTGEPLYGRNREKRDLLDLLIAQRIVLLHSPSGAGKSSLINAGLIPNLLEERFRVLPVARVHLDPKTALGAKGLELVTTQAAGSFNRYIFSILLSFEENLPPDQRRPLDELACSSLEDYLTCCPKGEAEPDDIVLIFDQFEEIITANPTDREGKTIFFSQLGQVLQNPRRWALFAMREDYVPTLDPYVRLLPTRLANTFRLDFLGEEASRQAIQNPARDQGVTFSREAADKLIGDLRTVQVQQPDGTWVLQPGLYVEPVQLQVVCSQLWDRLKMLDGKLEITPDDLKALGDVEKSLVDQSLAEYYADRVKKVADDTGVSERAIREWVQGELITEGGVRGLVLYTATASKGLKNEAIWALVASHLVRSEKRAEKTWVALAHDRLIDPFREDNEQWRSKYLNLLQRQAGRWASLGRPDSLLMRGQDLTEAQAWALAHAEELTDPEKNFLKKSQDIAQEEERSRLAAERELKQTLELESAQKLAEAERQRAEEQAKYALRLRRYLRLLIGAIVVAVLAVLAFFALGEYTRRTTQAAASAAQAAKAQSTKDAVAAQTAVAQATMDAVAAGATQAAAQLVANQAIAQAGAARVVATQAIAQVEAAQLVATQAIAQVEAAQLVATQAIAQAVVAQTMEVEQLAAEASRNLAESSGESLDSQPDLALLLAVEAFKKNDTQEARTALQNGLLSNLPKQTIFPPRGGRLASAQLSPDGSQVAWGYESGLVQVGQMGNQQVISMRNKGERAIRGLAFSRDSQVVAGVDQTGRIRLWDTGQGTFFFWLNGLLSTDTLAFNEVPAMEAGSILASAGTSNGTIYLWDLKERIAYQPGYLKPKSDPQKEGTLAQSPDERQLTSKVSSLAWSPDGSQLASGDIGGRIYLWKKNGWIGRASQVSLPGPVYALAWSPPNGLRLVAGGDDPKQANYLILWTFGQNTQPEVSFLTGHNSKVTSAAFSQDGVFLASGDAGGVIRLWDPATGQQIGEPLAGLGATVMALAFSPNGNYLYAVGGQGTVEQWDLRALLKETLPDTLVQLACRQAGRTELTQAEWASFFPTEDFRPTCNDTSDSSVPLGTATPTPTSTPTPTLTPTP